MKKQKKANFAKSIPAILMVVFLSISAWADTKEKAVHPELSEQEKLVACATCHREATPEVEKEWYNSVHGIAMVKCYQCHGTFEDFALTPMRETCGSCHADMLKKCPQDKPCWECHVPHSFKVKK